MKYICDECGFVYDFIMDDSFEEFKSIKTTCPCDAKMRKKKLKERKKSHKK